MTDKRHNGGVSAFSVEGVQAKFGIQKEHMTVSGDPTDTGRDKTNRFEGVSTDMLRRAFNFGESTSRSDTSPQPQG